MFVNKTLSIDPYLYSFILLSMYWMPMVYRNVLIILGRFQRLSSWLVILVANYLNKFNTVYTTIKKIISIDYLKF